MGDTPTRVLRCDGSGIRVEPVLAIGERTVVGFAMHETEGCGVRTLDLPVYPAAQVAKGEALTALRREHDLSLREAARRVDLPVVLVSDLEQGRAKFADDASAAEYARRLAMEDRR